MAWPETRPDGTPLSTVIDGEVRHWFCRGGLDLARVIPAGLLTEAQALALWNARDMTEQKRCRQGDGILPPPGSSPA